MNEEEIPLVVEEEIENLYSKIEYLVKRVDEIYDVLVPKKVEEAVYIAMNDKLATSKDCLINIDPLGVLRDKIIELLTSKSLVISPPITNEISEEDKKKIRDTLIQLSKENRLYK